MLLNWLRKKRKLSHLPCFTIELAPEGSVLIQASWARPEDPDEFAAIIKCFVRFLMLMKDSKLFAVFQHAISVYGHNHDDEECAKAILITLQKVMDDGSNTHHVTGEPLVKPTEAFHRT